MLRPRMLLLPETAGVEVMAAPPMEMGDEGMEENAAAAADEAMRLAASRCCCCCCCCCCL